MKHLLLITIAPELLVGCTTLENKTNWRIDYIFSSISINTILFLLSFRIAKGFKGFNPSFHVSSVPMHFEDKEKLMCNKSFLSLLTGIGLLIITTETFGLCTCGFAFVIMNITGMVLADIISRLLGKVQYFLIYISNSIGNFST